MQTAPEVLEVERLASDANVSMSRVLEHARVSPSTYWRWRNDGKEPLTKTIRKLKSAISELTA